MKKSDYLNKINEYYAGTKAPNYDKDSPMSTTTQNDWQKNLSSRIQLLIGYTQDKNLPIDNKYFKNHFSEIVDFVKILLADARKEGVRMGINNHEKWGDKWRHDYDFVGTFGKWVDEHLATLRKESK